MKTFQEFIKKESAPGQLLVLAAVLALFANNSFFSPWYDQLLKLPVVIQFGEFSIAKPLLLWINDGLMAIFFFVIGLEVKREILGGNLSTWRGVALPAFAAVGGMLFPALIYSYINWGDASAMEGWAIPSATDIAFALGILALLGKRVPVALKVFLLTLAVIDDMGAVVIIALFYTSDLSTMSLAIAAVALAVLALLNRNNVTSYIPYVVVGLILWTSVLKSGVHATLAGLALAFFIPHCVKSSNTNEESPLVRAEHSLHPWVNFGVLPLFAFANAGLSFAGMSLSHLFEPIPLGIALGLFLGNPIGIMFMSWLAIRLKIAQLPKGTNWGMIFGTSILCGVGFTMSLFIGGLAFEHTGIDQSAGDRLGILVGSFFSAITGFLVLKYVLNRRAKYAQDTVISTS